MLKIHYNYRYNYNYYCNTYYSVHTLWLYKPLLALLQESNLKNCIICIATLFSCYYNYNDDEGNQCHDDHSNYYWNNYPPPLKRAIISCFLCIDIKINNKKINNK